MPDVADLKTHLDIDDDDHDGELTLFLASATEMVRDWSTEVTSASISENVAVRGGVAVLSRYPVTAITSVWVTAAGDYGYHAGYAPASMTGFYILNAAAGLIYVPTCDTTVTVQYTAGVVTESARFQLAVLEVAAYLWRGRKGGSASYLPAGEPDVGGGPALLGGIKRRALLILGNLSHGPSIA